MNENDVMIVSVARTPMGSFQGVFKELTATQLGSVSIKAAVDRAQISADAIEEVVMGCVLPAGQGQAPARQASLGAGLPLAAGCTTINKMCGSGMKAVMLTHDLILAGSANIAVAGGMESMTNAPHLLPRVRSGYRLGHQEVKDHMFLDGLEDAYDKGRLMGAYAEDCAGIYQFSREEQDAFAITSLERAKEANEDGSFNWEITPVAVKKDKIEQHINRDEQPFKADLAKIPNLRPAFKKNGSVTAANSSSISDGAAALVLMSRKTAIEMGLNPIARVVAHSTHAQEPGLFTTAPVGALEKIFSKTGWSAEDIDLFEINEAFAVVPMVAMREHKLDHEKVNVHGGACALGHPIGASGARVLVTLIGALHKSRGRRGVAALCIGGGEATAVALEMENS
ncbi:MAG: acetyl-CoA acetyltransferase [Betaproteobacteria bacterium TMED22]|nr:MAG: acetyl-CoA acetyltransferase [Betaproteobacteria bacterium TMED22]|tara:strand:+ start:11138 stop:12328 length:1191 start_codon:yes stop_codon:yes gene_type:complete